MNAKRILTAITVSSLTASIALVSPAQAIENFHCNSVTPAVCDVSDIDTDEFDNPDALVENGMTSDQAIAVTRCYTALITGGLGAGSAKTIIKEILKRTGVAAAQGYIGCDIDAIRGEEE